MNFKASILNMLAQLEEVLNKLTDTQYVSKVPVLSGSTIGQHTRHIIEFYLELNNGYESGTINYDNRKRDHTIESDRNFSIEKINEISVLLSRKDKELSLMVNYGISAADEIIVSTNYARELIYNLEHTVHHMALIRVAVSSVSTLLLPGNFGVAISTLQFRLQCAQ